MVMEMVMMGLFGIVVGVLVMGIGGIVKLIVEVYVLGVVVVKDCR